MSAPLPRCREFVETMMPQFAADNPQLAVEAAVRRGQHPGLLAEYCECRWGAHWRDAQTRAGWYVGSVLGLAK